MFTKQKGPTVEVETYKNTKAFEKDAEKRLGRGWELTSQSGLDQEIAKLRTLRRAVLTGGVGLAVAGRAKKGDVISATWTKQPS